MSHIDPHAIVERLSRIVASQAVELVARDEHIAMLEAELVQLRAEAAEPTPA